MPRKKSQKEAVAERTEARLAEQRQRREQAAQERQQRAEAKKAEATDPVAATSASKPPKERRVRKRIHGDMVTVAIKGEFADKMRKLAEQTQMSLGKLLRDMILVYEGQLEGGYQPGTNLQQWKESQAGEQAAAE